MALAGQRLVAVSRLPAGFSEYIMRAWLAEEQARGLELRIRQVEEIPRPPGGKFQDFTSDFFPPRDE